MKLVVGLGNPGKEYASTRHNVGFMAVDEIVRRHSSFESWKEKFKGHVSVGMVGVQKVVLLKPQTFMNLSGQSVQQAANFYNIDVTDIIVLHDEIDIDFLDIRIKVGGSDAGHNGLKSITNCMGSGDYTRVRLGVGHPKKLGLNTQVSTYVLNPFPKAEREAVDEMLSKLVDEFDLILKGELKEVQNKFKKPKVEKL